MSENEKDDGTPPVVLSGRAALIQVIRNGVKYAVATNGITAGQEAALDALLLALEGMKQPNVDAMVGHFLLLDAQGRKEAVAMLGLMEQLSHPMIGIALKVATEQGDAFAVPAADGSGTNIWLGEGDPPEGSDDRGDAISLPGNPQMPIQVLKKLLESKGGKVLDLLKKKISAETGVPVEDLEIHAEMIDMGDGEGIPRLQDDYEDDPIARLARTLDKLPKGKRPRLAPKKLPEC